MRSVMQKTSTGFPVAKDFARASSSLIQRICSSSAPTRPWPSSVIQSALEANRMRDPFKSGFGRVG
jgi:hypothetical protein